MQEISNDQMTMTVKLKFNEGGRCKECVKNSECSGVADGTFCSSFQRSDGKNGNWILDDGK